MNRWFTIQIVLLAGIFTAGAVATAPADQVDIVATRDNTLFESGTGALSNGAGVHFFAGKTNGGAIRRGLIYFDVAANVPAGSAITGATLKLTLSKSSVAGSETVSIHKALADWGEGASDAVPPNDGGGSTALTGDATWIHRFSTTSTWTTAGGDFESTASAGTTVGTTLTAYTWASTSQTVADVQGWLNAPATNFGWVVKGNEAANGTAKQFDAREDTTPANRPTLTVDYTPAPAAVSGWQLF